MKQKTKSGDSSLLVFFLVFVVVVAGYFIWRNPGWLLNTFQETQKPEQPTLSILEPTPKNGKASPTAKLTPRPILQGKETYSIGQSASATPKIRSLEVDPHDPKVNDNQTLKVRVVDSRPVQSVKVTIGSDNKTRDFDLKLTEGSNLDGKWTLTWKVDDTVLYSYYFTINAVGMSSRSNVTVSIR